MNAVLFCVTACFWGGSFIAIHPLVEIMPPLLAGALRLGVALVFLSILFPCLRVSLHLPKVLRARIWGTGVVAFTIPFSLLFWGERSISPGLAGILNGTVPIWVFILGLIFTPKAEPFSFRKIAGLVFGITGIVAIFLPKVLASGSDPSLLGTLAVALMAVSYATGVLLNRTIFIGHPTLSPFTNLFHQVLAGFISLSLVSLFLEGVPHPETWTPLSTVILTELYLGVVSTSVAFMLFYRLIRSWGSVRAATVTYAIPAVALGFDLVLNSHFPTVNEVLGVIGITVGVVVLNLPAPRRQGLSLRQGV